VSAEAMRDITEGPVGRAVLRLAWPVVASEAIHTLFHFVDLAWVGRLGAWATASVSSSMFALWTVFAIGNLVATGLTAQVSRAMGAGDRDRAAHVAAQGLLLAVGLGGLVGVAGWFGAGPLFHALGVSAEVARGGASYFAICAAGAPAAFFYLGSSAVMRSCGDTRTPLLVTASALAANGVLAPFLIYGWGPFPRWEVAGAAIATVLCMSAGAVAFLVIAARGHRSFPFRAASLAGPDFAVLTGQIRIGAPYALVGILFSVNYLVFARVAAAFGDAAVAVIGISNRLESVTYLGADGFAAASATMVGQNLGAGRPDRAEKAARIATAIMAVAATAYTALLLVAPALLLRIFTPDPQVVVLGCGYLRILALCQIATAVEGTLGGVFAGSGDTVPPMTIHLVFGLLRPPLAVLLVGPLGLAGVAVTITASCIVRASLLGGIFVRGRWKTHELPGWIPPPLPGDEAPDLSVGVPPFPGSPAPGREASSRSAPPVARSSRSGRPDPR